MDFARRIQASMEDFATGDVSSTVALWHPQVRWYAVGHSPVAGKFVGPQEALAYLDRLGRLTDGTFRTEIVEVRPMFGETYVARLRLRAAAGNTTLDCPGSLIIDVDGDRVVSIVEVHHDQAAWDAFWTHAAAAAAADTIAHGAIHPNPEPAPSA
jgi:ketosteroid isomerase-like protein